MSDVRGPLKAALGGERPDPDAFSRTLERVRRRDQSRRLLATVVGAVVLAGSGVGLWTGLRGLGSTPVLDSSPAPSTQESEGHVPFVPPTYREGDRVVMPVTFPDGTTAEVTYPSITPELHASPPWLQYWP